MSVEVRPLSVKCNIQCQYCYQHPQRDGSDATPNYSLDKIKQAVLREGGPFTIFGGEPLLVPLLDLEDLWRWGLETFGTNAIQTNGTLINEEHIRLFKTYRVSVGISVDGPGELNDVRWHGSIERTRESTAKTQAAIERLCEREHPPSLIVTLHRGNADPVRLPCLLTWFEQLVKCGVRSIRLHLLESEDETIRTNYGLSSAENINALRAIHLLSSHVPGLKIDLFPEMRRLLTGDDRVTTCVWYACDPYTTRAVRGVEGQGQSSNCGRTNKDGVDFQKGAHSGYERYLALYQTPQEFMGCRDCRFFLMCKGQCPGTAVDQDWRNRTEHCEVWKQLFTDIEQDLLEAGQLPLSVHSHRQIVETSALRCWEVGSQVSLFSICTELGITTNSADLLGERSAK